MSTVPAKKKVKLCKALVRDQKTGLDPKPCGTDLAGETRCPNRSRHVNKYRTGFCIDGNCEGTERVTSSGGYHKTCSAWLTCPCQCHEQVSLMYKMTGVERKLPITKYQPPKNEFVIPTIEDVAQEIGIEVVKSEHPEIPTRINNSSKGRRRPLDELVQMCAEDWVLKGKKFYMTPAHASEWIAKETGLPAPSRGAIHALFKRWESLEFAFIAKSPTRFAGFTKKGVTHGLAGLKKKSKQ